MSFFRNLWKKLTIFFIKFKPGPIAWKGAFKSIAFTTVVIWILVSATVFAIEPKTYFGLPVVLLGLILAFLLGSGAILVKWIITTLPEKLLWVLPGCYFLMSIVFGLGGLGWQFPLFIAVFSGAMGAGIYALKKGSRNTLTLIQKITSISGIAIGLGGLVWGLIWYFDTGFEKDPDHINAAAKSTYEAQHIQLPNPAEPGSYEVGYLTYGSGKDKQRPEFGDGATIITDSVDASRLIDNWGGIPGKLRTWYWGFDDEALPINGRVWYPKGDGPFPLALIVHGNHSMFDYSDPGYDYLGELLASQGIIMVSVDENFINSGWTDLIGGLEEENDARGWLLLEHLRYWRKWNKEEGNDFFGKVDMNNLAVMGHSRGGEAAAIAGFFNTLKHYPDDAKQEFDFGFNIKAVVSIAPVDGQYKPGEVGTPLKDVNYLVIHGANDGDVQSFSGLRQYERIEFSDSTDFFKSAVYVYGANHGQFNTTWGNNDMGFPFGKLLNTDALMPMEDQLEIGKIYISAFLQATLQGKSEYENLFKDYRAGKNWLPETIYLNQYQESDWKVLTGFEEDLDLNTSSDGGSITSENLTVWKEKMVGMKWGNRATRSVYIGWDSLAYEGDTASYQIQFAEPLDASLHDFISFELSEARGSTYPDKERDEKKKDQEEKGENESEADLNDNSKSTDEDVEKSEDKEDEEEKAPEPIDFTIELRDVNNNVYTMRLSDYSYLQRQLSVDVLKNPGLQSTKTSEAVFNTFFIDLSKLKQPNDNAIIQISSIKFVFDQTNKGLIILDKVAIH